MRLTVCGIPRSGSTLVWQILRALYPQSDVTKTHPDVYIPDGAFIFSTIRHPYDVAASRYRVRLSRGGDGVEGSGGLRAEIAVMRVMYDGLRTIRNHRGILLRYEQFHQDHTLIYNAVEERLWRKVTEEERLVLSTLYSVDMNRERAARLTSFNEQDGVGIHGDHIGPVVPGSWISLPKWQKEIICQLCEPIAKEWGYETQ